MAVCPLSQEATQEPTTKGAERMHEKGLSTVPQDPSATEPANKGRRVRCLRDACRPMHSTGTELPKRPGATRAKSRQRRSSTTLWQRKPETEFRKKPCIYRRGPKAAA